MQWTGSSNVQCIASFSTNKIHSTEEQNERKINFGFDFDFALYQTCKNIRTAINRNLVYTEPISAKILNENNFQLFDFDFDDSLRRRREPWNVDFL